jgi:hypothetical protein
MKYSIFSTIEVKIVLKRKTENLDSQRAAEKIVNKFFLILCIRLNVQKKTKIDDIKRKKNSKPEL